MKAKISTVDTTSGTFDYHTRTQRQIFHANGHHYVFYVNSNEELVYRSSQDGEHFSNSSQPIARDIWSIYDFSLYLENESSVHLAYSSANFSVNPMYETHYRHGTIRNDGTIDWDTAYQIAEESADRPFITLNSEKHSVIVYRAKTDRVFYWRIGDEGESGSWSAPNELLNWTTTQDDFYPSVYGLAESGLMFIYWHGKTDRVYARYWNGSHLASPELLYNCFDYYMTYNYFYYCWSAIVDDNSNVYFTNPAGQVKMWNSTLKSWSIDRNHDNESGEISGGLCYDENTGDVYLFALNMSTGHIGYYKKSGNRWEEDKIHCIISGKTLLVNSIISFESANQGYIGLRWYDGSGTHGDTKTLYYWADVIADISNIAPQLPRPAEFQVTEMNISMDEVKPGEDVLINIEVRNTGEESGEYTLPLYINGVLEDSEEVILEGGESTIVAFNVEKEIPGTYNVTVSNLHGKLIVKDVPGSKFNWTASVITVVLIAGLALSILLYNKKRKKEVVQI